MKVLLATDGLPAAEAAERLLIAVARRDVEVIVAAAAGKRDPSGESAAQEVVTRAVGRMEKAGFHPMDRPLQRDAAEALPRFVDEENVDIVVLGAGNKSWLGRILFGSISTQMLHSRSSVLIVNEPPGTEDGKISVLFALDGSAEAAVAVREAVSLLAPDRCAIRVFSVVAVRVPAFSSAAATGYAAPGFDEKLEAELTAGPRRAAEEHAKAFIEAGFETEVRVTLGAPVKRILEEARDIDAGLVVVGARPRGGLERALVGSISDQVARYTPAALIVRPPQGDDRSLR